MNKTYMGFYQNDQARDAVRALIDARTAAEDAIESWAQDASESAAADIMREIEHVSKITFKGTPQEADAFRQAHMKDSIERIVRQVLTSGIYAGKQVGK